MSVGDKILEPNLVILASAGSGKTYQLGNRIIGLVGLKDQAPERIVALTFTRKAAGEFADAVLTKLAKATLGKEAAEELWKDLGGTFAVEPVLAQMVRSLPRLQLGTMDGFFARVVRGFQYELGLSGGTFELIEGPRQAAAMAEILNGVLGDALDNEEGEEFLHAFRRATHGKEGQGVLELVREFMKDWHTVWKSGVPPQGWGGGGVFGQLPEVGAWEEQKASLVQGLRGAGDNAKVEKVLDAFLEHTVGSGRLGEAEGKITLFPRLKDAVAEGGTISVKENRRMLEFDADQSRKWRELFSLVASCELAAAVERTTAVGDLVARLDGECARRLRNRGLLGFDDVKVLMGAWTRSEDDRLRREAVDFRLDGRYDHWLLDEFQDTSAAEWDGMEPLLDEAATGEDGSLFVVGDRKQAIYGWRGGDVALFDRLEERYSGRLEVCTMPESWRSCPAVLELVNRVCGDEAVISGLFGPALAKRWPWEEHVSAKPKVTGASRVEEVPPKEIDQRLVEILEEVGAGKRELSCGVLVRTNPQVRATAAHLREAGFDVIEEGRRLPVEDNAPGVVLLHLVRWLADPADRKAREVVAMSPLEVVLQKDYGDAWQARWEGLLEEARRDGFAGMAEALLEQCWGSLSTFSRRRAGDVLAALAEFDAGGGVTAREARDWITDLEVSQAPGVAAVQVMTIHKSKGLGFDVVVLPGLEDRQIPDRGKFDVARGGRGDQSWVLQPPAKWVRDLLPDLQVVEDHWAADQRYEAMCLLYVALTRAKRGLYVLLPEEAKSRQKKDEVVGSLANWVRQTAGDGFSSGTPQWFEELPDRTEGPAPSPATLGEATPRRGRVTPSSRENYQGGTGGSGALVGREVHALFERIGWLEAGEVPRQPRSQAGAMVEELLREAAAHAVFEKPEGAVDLHREQAFEVLLDGRWMSGVIDRMHVHRDADGKATQVEIIDFKTDRVEAPEELVERYGDQLDAYARAVQAIFGKTTVRKLLLSTALRAVVEL